jgi:hypothetical protein
VKVDVSDVGVVIGQDLRHPGQDARLIDDGGQKGVC